MFITEWAAADQAQLDGDGARAMSCDAEQCSMCVDEALAELRQIAASEGSAVGAASLALQKASRMLSNQSALNAVSLAPGLCPTVNELRLKREADRRAQECPRVWGDPTEGRTNGKARDVFVAHRTGPTWP